MPALPHDSILISGLCDYIQTAFLNATVFVVNDICVSVCKCLSLCV